MMVNVSAISVRVRRVTEEVAYIRVPVTQEILASLGPPGNGDVLAAEAVRLASADGLRWVIEDDPRIEVHPVQKPGTE